ncbi:MAG TPA: hypothetical protein VMF69_09700 [Gemmataceae bacterium]|nr:hypothetical protein [Gemmataceae bacterium]
MRLYKTAQYGILLFLIAWFITGAFLAFSLPGNSLLDHPIWGKVFFATIVAIMLCWGLVTLVHNRIHAEEFRFLFDGQGVEKLFRRLLGLMGVKITDQLPRCTALFDSVMAIVFAVVLILAIVNW